MTHHSRKREKEKRIILVENGEMNTIMAHSIRLVSQPSEHFFHRSMKVDFLKWG